MKRSKELILSLCLIFALGAAFTACDFLPANSGNSSTGDTQSSSEDSSIGSTTDLPNFNYRKSDDGSYYIFTGANNATYVAIAADIDGIPVKEIAANAFPADTWGVYIPASVTKISPIAFQDCSDLTEIKVAEENTEFSTIDNNLYNKSGTALLKYAGGKDAVSFTIPETVTEIGSCAFSYTPNLTEVLFHDDVAEFGNSIFQGSSVVKIRATAEQFDCLPVKIFEDITITSGAVLDYAFSDCNNLVAVTILDGVESIGSQAFAQCSSVVSVWIGESVTEIADDAFEACTVTKVSVNKDVLTKFPLSQLKDVRLTGTGTLTGSTFYRCSVLEKLELCEGITKLNGSAVNVCDNLKVVILPKSLQTVNKNGFNRCANIEAVYYNGSETDWSNIELNEENPHLVNPPRYYYSAETPTENVDRFWHYDEHGEPVVWG